MPLAAIKRQARELPVSIVLDDSSLLRPGTSLSQFEQLKLGARVSRSGQPVAQAVIYEYCAGGRPRIKGSSSSTYRSASALKLAHVSLKRPLKQVTSNSLYQESA